MQRQEGYEDLEKNLQQRYSEARFLRKWQQILQSLDNKPKLLHFPQWDRLLKNWLYLKKLWVSKTEQGGCCWQAEEKRQPEREQALHLPLAAATSIT